jgi:cytochrome c553
MVSLRRAGIGVLWTGWVLLAGPAWSQGEPAPPAAAACATCHGSAGISTDQNIPKLAAQQVNYVLKQLKEAASGKRKGDTMTSCVSASQDGDLSALAVYYATQKPVAGRPPDATLAAAGQALFDGGNKANGVSACTSCHEAGALGSDKHPRLAGQHRDYIVRQIRSFKAGTRSNDLGRQMRNVAEKLTDEDIAAAAEYLSSL